MNRALFTSGQRTPFGRAFKGAYREVRADDLLVELLQVQTRNHPDWCEYGIDDLVLGCAYPEGEQGYNLGRVAALGTGLDVPGMTIASVPVASKQSPWPPPGFPAGGVGCF